MSARLRHLQSQKTATVATMRGITEAATAEDRDLSAEEQSAFDTHKTPELNGNIVSVSADLTVDQMTGVPYYLARISIPRTELARLKQKHLVPGMPAEIYVRTQHRTVLSYLFKPIEDQMERAFRER